MIIRRNLLAAALLGAVLVTLAVRLPMAAAQRAGDYAFFDPIVDVQHLVRKHFYKETESEDLQLGAINGMIEALEDPYTEYIPPQDIAEFDKQVRGEFVGIGATKVTFG